MCTDKFLRMAENIDFEPNFDSKRTMTAIDTVELRKLKQRITDLEAQLKDREWVSVEDELPDEGVYVLVFSQEHGVFRACHYDGVWGAYKSHLSGGCCWVEDDFCNEKITDWMPLPQPPQEKDDE